MKYYFNLQCLSEVIEDEEGTEFGSLEAALEQARLSIEQARLSMRELLAAAIKNGHEESIESIIFVMNDHGTQVAAVPARTVLSPRVLASLTERDCRPSDI